MSFPRLHPARLLLAPAALLALGACSDDAPAPADPSASVAGAHGAAPRYGPAVALGNGTVRTYIVPGAGTNAPVAEVGVAFSATALDGLPAHGHGTGEHGNMVMLDLAMPAGNVTPIRFVELDWNPAGHEPAAVYGAPHFDFHFWTVGPAERAAIDPADPRFQQKADNLPASEFRPPFYSTLAPPGAPTPAIPFMGVHWIDPRSPELQGMLGRPEAYRPFTATFIYGSWDGKFTFLEPMITRAHILSKRTATAAADRDQVVPIEIPARYAERGLYPKAYRMTWNEAAREYRIALVQFERRD